MDTILKGNKRSAENDNAVTIERFLKSKRLRRTLMNEKEGSYNEEGGTEEGRDTGQYDEEMVIVVVQKEGDDPMQNEYQHLVDNLAIEEEVAYDFINEHENSVNFMNESVSSGIEQQPMLSSQVQQQQITSANLDPVARRIIGTKSLKVRNEICRLCLSKHHNMCSLFDTSLTFIKSSLKEIIETCIGIKVLRDDATDRICRACISRLESIWAFREQCEVSDRMVKQMKKVKYVQSQSQSEGDRNQNLIYLPNNDPPSTSNEETRENADNPLQFFCNDCERKFHTEIALAAHVTNDHAHLKPFTHNTSFLVSCSLCGRKVLKKVLHDHYLQHKLAGEDKNVTANHREAYEVEKEEEEDEEYVDDVTYYEGNQQNMEENGMHGEQQLASFPNVADTATLDAGQITGFLNKENELAYNQNECLVTDITGNEFRVEGQDIMGADEDPNMIAVGINEQGGNYAETAPQYTQVYLMNQGENLVEGSQGNNVENSIPVMQDVVSTGSMDDNHIYVVASDGKSMYVDNQDVVFQIANDQVYQADSGRKNEIEVVYETPANMTDLGLVKEEVIDPSYDE